MPDQHPMVFLNAVRYLDISIIGYCITEVNLEKLFPAVTHQIGRF